MSAVVLNYLNYEQSVLCVKDLLEQELESLRRLLSSGTLEPGRWADLVVLERNPLENIKNTRAIRDVYIAGNRVH